MEGGGGVAASRTSGFTRLSTRAQRASSDPEKWAKVLLSLESFRELQWPPGLMHVWGEGGGGKELRNKQ